MFVPLQDRILIKPIQEENKTQSGIIIPDSIAPKPTRGTVLAVGEGRYLDSGQLLVPAVVAGHIVAFAKHAGTPIEVGGDECLLMRESEIFAIVG